MHDKTNTFLLLYEFLNVHGKQKLTLHFILNLLGFCYLIASRGFVDIFLSCMIKQILSYSYMNFLMTIVSKN